MKRRLPQVFAATMSLLIVALVIGTWRDANFWFTPDQRGDRLFRQGQFADAAETYVDPYRRAIALYRADKFKEAAAAFATVNTADAAFDRGNSFVMLGKYDEAVTSYERALALRPEWNDAIENRALAVIRRDRLKSRGGDDTGGRVKPDEIVFDKNKHTTGTQTTEVAGGDPLSDEQLRGLWLRRVQTKPADFLRAKFAFQAQQQKGGTP